MDYGRHVGSDWQDNPDLKLKLIYKWGESSCLVCQFINNKSLIIPVKNMTWILEEIPCHFSSQLDLVAVWSKSTPNPKTIPCNLSSFNLFSVLEHDMDFGQVQVMEFPGHLLRKWWDFHRIWSHFRWKTSVKKTWENPSHILFREGVKGEEEEKSVQNFPPKWKIQTMGRHLWVFEYSQNPECKTWKCEGGERIKGTEWKGLKEQRDEI